MENEGCGEGGSAWIRKENHFIAAMVSVKTFLVNFTGKFVGCRTYCVQLAMEKRAWRKISYQWTFFHCTYFDRILTKIIIDCKSENNKHKK